MINPTVLLIPGTHADKYGNILLDKGESDGSLRARFDFVMALDVTQLHSVTLPDLLNWLRWGSQTGVMWEFELSEMIALIEKWETVNEDNNLYEPRGQAGTKKWEALWGERGTMLRNYSCYLCPCGATHLTSYSGTAEGGDCQKCGRSCHEFKRISSGPRGQNTYNLGLNGADGWDVASAARLSRGLARPLVELKYDELRAYTCL